MKTTILCFFLLCFSANTFAQEEVTVQRYTAHNKGKFFISWGGNRDTYSRSDVNFRGKDYNFTVENMKAHDKPKGWHIDYINPVNMTIPQTNFRMGYFVSDHYSVSVGWDHMKYVMSQNQTANVNGYINLPADQPGSIYNGVYNNRPVDMSQGGAQEGGFGKGEIQQNGPAFLMYEHTDGLNYVNTEVSRHDDISKWFGIRNTDKIQINLTEGLGAGLLYPKTNTTLLGKQRHDDFHISGYGLSAKAGINITFFKYFYIQEEFKGGYINMQDIRTSQNTEDRASQNFFFFQKIIAVGGIFRI
ncbi:membrane protein [Flavobacterium sp. CFS9]|uniref:Membrane protein n=1 Tax=Flavobacterium sp. CFS9 TaxID=3143118 RepID=A0AAT9H579_9FLAO